jgi:hypothetical protein
MSNKDMTERSGLNTPKKTKLATILILLVSGRSLNKFEAENHHDHCLNTTVSTLQNGHGIVIDRERETVPCLNGVASTNKRKVGIGYRIS